MIQLPLDADNKPLSQPSLTKARQTRLVNVEPKLWREILKETLLQVQVHITGSQRKGNLTFKIYVVIFKRFQKYLAKGQDNKT